LVPHVGRTILSVQLAVLVLIAALLPSPAMGEVVDPFQGGPAESASDVSEAAIQNPTANAEVPVEDPSAPSLNQPSLVNPQLAQPETHTADFQPANQPPTIDDKASAANASTAPTGPSSEM